LTASAMPDSLWKAMYEGWWPPSLSATAVTALPSGCTRHVDTELWYPASATSHEVESEAADMVHAL